MRMQSLARAGGKTAFIAWALGWAARLAGFTGWPEDVLVAFFLIGCADLLIASSLTIAWTLRDYLEQRERRQPGGGGHLADGAFQADERLGRAPCFFSPSPREMLGEWSLAAPWPPEKRLAPPLPPSHPLVDRYGAPCPVHYAVLPEERSLTDGERTVAMEMHTDAGHADCPMCEARRREPGR